jgi:hypothetical protein
MNGPNIPEYPEDIPPSLDEVDFYDLFPIFTPELEPPKDGPEPIPISVELRQLVRFGIKVAQRIAGPFNQYSGHIAISMGLKFPIFEIKSDRNSTDSDSNQPL